MENVTFVALFCYFFCLTTGTESIAIENCNDKFITIRRNTKFTIVCEGFNQSHTIEWSIKRQQKTQVATCYPSSNCTVCQPDLYAVERSPTQSRLLFQQHEVDIGTMVFCQSNLAGTKRTASCTFDVIIPAKLSSCAVEEDGDSGKVKGRCRFDHAYSNGRGFSCTWYQETDGQSRSFPGDITYDSGSDGPSGWCAFSTTREPGTYTYSIYFYPGPGPGHITVDIGNLETTVENSVPVGAIAGGIAAAVGIIVVVVVVVVVIRRKRRQKPTGSPDGSGDVASKDNNDFEEHVNPMYVTSDVPDDTHTTDHKPSAIAVRISSNSHNGHPAAPHSLEADMYTTVDDEARFVANNQAGGMGGRSGGYEDIGVGSSGNTRAPQTDEYAVVDKSRTKKGPSSSANTSASSPTHTTEGNNEYAVVDKSSSRNKTAKSIKVAEAKTEGAAYTQVQKPKPAVKPKTSTKPSSDKDVTQRGAEDDDEYHTLSHTRGSPHTQDQADLEPQYSHIGHD